MKFLFLVCCFLSPAFSAAAQKTPAPPAGDISGTVRDADGQPVPDALVDITARRSGDNFRAQARPKPDGSFRVNGLRPGLYTVRASAPGLAQMPDEGESVDGFYRPGSIVNLRLARGSVITGTVREEDGAAAIAVRVQAVRVQNERGEKVRSGWGPGDLTDDRGVYRIYGLPPGRYLVAISYQGGWSLVPPDGLPPFYYPNGPAETAQQLELAYGQEISGINLSRRRLSGYKISGVASVPRKFEWPLQVILVTAGSGIVERQEQAAWQENGAAFALTDVPEGQYELFIETQDRNHSASAPGQRVTISGADITGLQFDLAEPGSVSGRVTLEKKDALAKRPECADTGRALPEEISLRFYRAEKKPPLMPGFSYRPNEPRELPDAAGNFKVAYIRAGFYRLTTQLPSANWYLRAFSAANKDLGRDGLTINGGAAVNDVSIFIAPGAASLKARLAPAREGAALPDNLFAYLVPAEKEAADNVPRYAETAVRHDGVLVFNNLAPGRYWLFTRPRAGDDTRPPFWDAAARARLRREAEATRREITLNPCQSVTDYTLPYQGAP